MVLKTSNVPCFWKNPMQNGAIDSPLFLLQFKERENSSPWTAHAFRHAFWGLHLQAEQALGLTFLEQTFGQAEVFWLR